MYAFDFPTPSPTERPYYMDGSKLNFSFLLQKF